MKNTVFDHYREIMSADDIDCDLLCASELLALDSEITNKADLLTVVGIIHNAFAHQPPHPDVSRLSVGLKNVMAAIEKLPA